VYGVVDLEAARRNGWFRVCHPLFPASRCTEALALAEAFFRLPAGTKEQLAIERSPHFRGYSVMHNSRDWREQIHFGREEGSRKGWPLRGPNLWPEDPAWRRSILSLMADLEAAGRDILATLTGFLPPDEAPYVLLKLIHYQPIPDASPRSGVAPHVDFSWITLLLQDDAGGLEIRNGEGEWQPAPHVPGTLLVNVGEILQSASGGYFKAAPHRVVSGARSRISLPFFLNPGLETTVHPVPHAPANDPEHVHRVFSEPRTSPFVFGEEEWRRKGLGVYCGSCFGAGLITSPAGTVGAGPPHSREDRKPVHPGM
jgi:isopenicillin N synthase-like dioxygenase